MPCPRDCEIFPFISGPQFLLDELFADIPNAVAHIIARDRQCFALAGFLVDLLPYAS